VYELIVKVPRRSLTQDISDGKLRYSVATPLNRKMGQMSEDPGPTLESGADDNNATRPFIAREQVTEPRRGRHKAPPTQPPMQAAPPTVAAPAQATPLPRPPIEAAPPTRPPIQAAPPTVASPIQAAPPTVAPPTQAAPAQAAPPTQAPAFHPPAGATAAVVTGDDPGDIVRYGPGVPAAPPPSQAALTAASVWRTGRLPEPSRRRIRLRRMLGTAFTVILLAASGVILYLRFHHAPFNVTGVAIVQQTHRACRVTVTGRITTNGAAGSVSYQWLFQPGRTASQPLSLSIGSGQEAGYVTVAFQGQGLTHGTASRTVILHVLTPDAKSVSTGMVINC
jgi:hypothetical protein